MALNGQLHDFNLAEILQLIASQQKSGFLVLEGHREMVFVFDKGLLISTRDRRSEAPDPLEVFLRNYGFFTEDQWAHIRYIRQNSSLDLTEILVSEELFSRDELNEVLKNVALEMAHRGMKMRRGRYNFTATKETPPGVRWRIAMDVQGLLMEAARRVDEETQLASLLPSQTITFAQGPTPPPANTLSATGRRIMKLALGGRPLGRIIRLARTDSFTTREMIKNFLDEQWLRLEEQTADQLAEGRDGKGSERGRRSGKLRHPLLTGIVVLLLLSFTGVRWLPVAMSGTASIGLAAPAASGATAIEPAAGTVRLAADQLASRQLRLRQIQDMVVESIRQYYDTHGIYPDELEQLERTGLLPRETWRIVAQLGWQYLRAESGLAYQISL